MLLCRRLDTSFSRIDGSSHNVEIASDDHFAAGSLQTSYSVLYDFEEVHLEWLALVVGQVGAVEIEEHKQAVPSAEILSMQLTQSRRPPLDPQCPIPLDQMPFHQPRLQSSSRQSRHNLLSSPQVPKVASSYCPYHPATIP